MYHKPTNILIAACGLLGTTALTLYFSAPFNFMPLPQPGASAAEVYAFGTTYHTTLLVDAWLQQFGTILSVIFSLGLVHIAGRSGTLAGRLTLLTCGVITSLSLAEGTFALGAVQSAEHGHQDAMLTCFELTNVFIHIFLLAPSLFLMMGLSLKGTTVLPKAFIVIAITLGILFQVLGVVALFNNKILLAVIIILMVQNVWTLAASVTLLVRKEKHFI